MPTTEDLRLIHVWMDDPVVVAGLRERAEVEQRSMKGMVQVAVKEWLQRQAEITK